MADDAAAQARELAGEARQWQRTYAAAEEALVAAARRAAAAVPDDLAVGSAGRCPTERRTR
jgi:hypothetical protein